MSPQMLKTKSKILFGVFVLLISFNALSQTPPTPGRSNGRRCDNPPCGRGNGLPGPPGLPIDGGLSFLIIAGAAYGVYELKRKK